MVKTKAQILKETKAEKRTFKEKSAMGNIQDRITELELRIEELEKSNI